MLQAAFSGSFKKESRLAKRRGWDTGKLDKVITMLINEQPLPPERKDHPLHGNFINIGSVIFKEIGCLSTGYTRRSGR